MLPGLGSVALGFEQNAAPAPQEDYLPLQSLGEDPPGPTEEPPQSLHAAWCLGRYDTYDVGTNTFLTDNKLRRECVSPYGAGTGGAD
ncbi:BA14K family protein [Rhodovulum sp. ES.010]|uniref:BA14K family protein n=1 Tax=Rhodovulum sp. ES.010 TaxID=1882821 RepID=UPI000941776A|nr:BA14K family protein [Rhodovulum sp. ES.010]